MSSAKVNKRFIILSIITIFIAISFWGLSRYPQLQAKADVAGVMQLEDKLAHQAIYFPDPDAGKLEFIGATFINWLWANKRGMAFAVIIASCFLTLLSYLPHRNSKNRFVNSIYGMFAGTPLGVCVNCVAPISKAVYEGGKTMQTALAMMFSSPKLNIIVLTMSFTLLPFYLAMINLVGTLFLILLIVPFISDKTGGLKQESSACDLPIIETWLSAVCGLCGDLYKSLSYIVIRTVPFMFLAGLLGAIAANLIDISDFSGDGKTSLLMLFAASFVGTFLPLPIAVDVMVVQSLIAAKMDIALVATLLFTLGIFSIYSFLIIWRTFSLKIAILLYIIITFLGVVIGYGAGQYNEYKVSKWLNYYDLYLQGYKDKQNPEIKIDKISLIDLKNHLHKTHPRKLQVIIDDDVEIQSIDYAVKTGDAEKLFSAYQGAELGIDYSNKIDTKNYIDVFYHGRGIASGDFNNDGWVDELVASDDGVILYQNINGKKFKPIDLAINGLDGIGVFFVALVDMDNDGWLDIYATTFNHGNFLVFNPLSGGKKSIVRFSTGLAPVTISASFADVNEDGKLDIFQANWTQGERPSLDARNQLMLSQADGSYKEVFLPEINGLSLTSLFSDINDDMKIDLLVGNDWVVPDNYYFGLGKGKFKPVNKLDDIFQITTYNTMSIDSSDFDNDGDLDLFMTGIGGALPEGEGDVDTIKTNDAYCLEIKDKTRRNNCFMHEVFSKAVFFDGDCQDVRLIADEQAVKGCMVAKMLFLATSDKNQDLCNKIPVEYNNSRSMCNNMFIERLLVPLDVAKDIPQRRNNNILLRQENGKFIDDSEAAGVSFSGWAWNAQFADLDNDGWQDLYVVSGSPMTNFVRFTNSFFHNQNGKKFTSQDVGLREFSHSSAYNYVDIDNDGDLDIITNTTDGPFYIYINNNQNNSISFELVDDKNNRNCIGCKITIIDDAGNKQIREIKASSGYLSFNAIMAHFGVKKAENIKEIHITWSDGEVAKLSREFPANKHYIIKRKNKL